MKSLKKMSFLKKLSMPHAFTMLLGILIFVGILTWIFEGTVVDEADEIKGTPEVAVIGAGIGDWLTSILGGFSGSIGVIMFLLVLGMYVNIVIKSGALNSFIGKLAQKFKTNLDMPEKTGESFKEKFNYSFKVLAESFRQTWIFIPLVFFFSFCGSTYGMSEESIAFYVIIIPLALAAGFDVWTGFLLIFIGCGTGVMGSTINPFSVVQASSSAKKAILAAGGDGAIADAGGAWRWAAWFILTVFTCGYIMWYGMKVKMNKEKSYVKDLFAVHKETFTTVSKEDLTSKMTKKHIATIVIFLLSFVFMALSMMKFAFVNESGDLPAMTGRGWSSLDGTAGTGADLGPWWEFGGFYFAELFAFFFIMALIIAAINWKGEKKFIEETMEGGRDFLGVCYAVGIATSIGVILAKSNLQPLIVRKLSDIIKNSSSESESGNNLVLALVSYILFIPLTFFVPSTSGLAKATFPVLGPSIESAGENIKGGLPGVIHGYGMAAGWANLFVPTYAVVIGALAVSKIGYGKFIQSIWKYLIMMFVLGLILLIFGSFITY